MPEPGQETLSRQLTTSLKEVLQRWTGPVPRLAYITDGGYQQARYFRQVLRQMSNPHHPGERLKWAWVVDYCLPAEYVYKMADALFPSPQEIRLGAGRCAAENKPNGIYRVLHSAAAIRGRSIVARAKRKQYRTAYNYLQKRIGFWIIANTVGIILSRGGVTEAACKTVFTQRLKQSGMTWKLEGGQWIVDLRVSYFSGIWSRVYQANLQAKPQPEIGTKSKGWRKTKTPKRVA